MPGEDDLFISASFDGSELITGFDGASSAIQESVSNITDSLEGLGTGMTEAGQGVENLVNQLTGVTSVTEQTTGQLSLFSDAILSSAPSAQEAAQALYEYELGVQALYDHLITLQPATEEAVQSVLQFDEALQVLMASSEGAGVALTEQAAATQEAGAALTGMDAALYEMSDAQLTATTAEQEYAESMNAVLSEMADVQLAQQEMTGSLSQYSLISNDAASKNAALTGALQTLSNELKGGVANLENIALAYQKVEQTAERANLQVQQTALGFRVLRDATGGAKQEISQVDSLLGYLGGRAGATEAGVGGLGFAFGTLARVLQPLNALMVAAFPVISLILVVDIIDNIIDKFEKLDDTIRKTEVAENDLATGILRAGQSLQLENLRLEDQISKLEGGVSENLIAEALIESEQEAEKLGKAFEDDLSSLIRLQEQGKVGVFYRIVEPEKAGTEEVGKDVKKKIEALQQAVSAQRVANAQLELDDTNATEKAKGEADHRVEIARKEAQDAITAQKEKVQNLIAEEQKTKLATTAAPGAPAIEVQGLSKEDAEAKYQPAVTLLNAADLALKQNIIDEKLLDEISANRTAKASDAQDALNRARERTVGEAQLKADEDALSQSLEKERNAANQRFKLVEDNEKLVVQQAIAHGEDRYKAEEDATKKVLTARQKLTSDLLLVEADRYREESAIQKRREELDTKTLVGDKLEAAEITNAEREKHLEGQKQIDIQKITADGIQGNLLLRAQEADAEEKINQEKTRRGINELQRTFAEQRRLIDEEIKLDEQKLASKYKVEENKPKIEQTEVTAFAKGGGGAIADVIELAQRKTINEEILSIDRARTAEEISLSRQKEAELTAALKQEETGYKTLYENGKITAEAYEKVVTDIERQITETKDVETAKRVLLQQKETDQEVRLSQEAEKQEEQLEMQLSQGMARELDKMLFQTKSFHDAMTKLWQDLVRMIIEEILKMVSAWVVAHTIMEAVHKVFDKKALTPGAGEEGVATTGRPKVEDVAAPSVSSVLAKDQTKEIAQTHELAAAKQQLSVSTKQVATSEQSVTAAMTAEQPTIAPLQASLRGLGQAEQMAAEHASELAASISSSAGANVALEATNATLATSEVGAAAADAFAQHIIDTGGLDIPGAIAIGAAVVAAGTPYITMASAAGGWDVPDTHSSYNTVIHPKEMVLDRPIAEGMRNIIARGMTSDDSGKGNTVFGGNVHFNYNPTVTGDMDPAKHGDAMFSFFQSKLQRMGVSIP